MGKFGCIWRADRIFEIVANALRFGLFATRSTFNLRRALPTFAKEILAQISAVGVHRRTWLKFVCDFSPFPLVNRTLFRRNRRFSSTSLFIRSDNLRADILPVFVRSVASPFVDGRSFRVTDDFSYRVSADRFFGNVRLRQSLPCHLLSTHETGPSHPPPAVLVTTSYFPSFSFSVPWFQSEAFKLLPYTCSKTLTDCCWLTFINCWILPDSKDEPCCIKLTW